MIELLQYFNLIFNVDNVIFGINKKSLLNLKLKF